MKTVYKLKCIGGFRDGNVFPRFIGPGEVLEGVDERLYNRFMRSAPGGFEVLDVVKIVPKSTKGSERKADSSESEG